MKSFGVCYWYVKIPKCGYMEHGLADITFYVHKTYDTFVGLFWDPAGSRQAARGAHIF